MIELVVVITLMAIIAGVSAPALASLGHARNASGLDVVVTLLRDGRSMRIFPIGARAAVNVPLRVVEDVDPDTVLELVIAAPDGCTGEVVLDFGLMEI